MSEIDVDRELARIRAGDEAALERWFHREADALYAFAYYRVANDPGLAADVVQSTFADALGRLEQFDPARGSMAAWLRMLARNVIRDTLREHRRHVPIDSVWHDIDQALERLYAQIDQAELPDEVLQRHETRELVSMTFANLPVQHRDLLNAKYIEEHSLESIARMRETTIDAVKAKLRRARAAFRKAFLTLAATEVG